MQQQIIDLKQELNEEKIRADKQLAEKDNQIKGYQKLLDQNQQLLLNEQNKELPSSGVKTSEGSTSKSHNESNFTETLEDQSDSDIKNKHWWTKLFNS